MAAPCPLCGCVNLNGEVFLWLEIGMIVFGEIFMTFFYVAAKVLLHIFLFVVVFA